MSHQKPRTGLILAQIKKKLQNMSRNINDLLKIKVSYAESSGVQNTPKSYE